MVAEDKKFADNNKFATFLHKVRPIFFSIYVGGGLLQAQFLEKFARKFGIFDVQTGGWASNIIFKVLTMQYIFGITSVWQSFLQSH